MLFRTLTETSEAVAAIRSWLGKIDLLRACLRQFAAGEIETGVGHLIGVLRQGAPEGVMADAKSPSTTANEFAISRRHGAALRARHTVPGRQGARGCRHDRYGSRNIHAAIALNANAIPAATRQDTCRDAHNRAQVSIRTRTNHRQGDFR